jgi:8-oxo-dGTP pyrophosphatase MutT (NUDIX family)
MIAEDRTGLTAAAFQAMARPRLLVEPPDLVRAIDLRAVGGDHTLNPSATDWMNRQVTRPAAVLVPIVDRPDGATVILTERTGNLPTHAGQIAFPGGRLDAGETPAEAALREAEEEIGLDRTLVEALGYSDCYVSGTGYSIAPLIGLVRPDHVLTINRGEVAEVFEVPLDFLMNGDNFRRESREIRGISRSFYAIPYDNRFIWGVTAGILRRLWERVYAS